MSRKRDLRDDERALWDEVMRDVRRMRGAKSAKAPTPKKPPRARSSLALPSPTVPSASPAKPVARSFGVDGSTAARLKRGKVEPEATLDLHGMTQAQAHSRLLTFVRRAFEHEFRCVLVVTGKGAPGAEGRGVLRTMVPRWLEEEALRPLVTGVHAAHQRHGGAGALYVYLRRQRPR